MKKLMIIGVGDIAQRTLPLLSDWLVHLSTRALLDLDAAVKDSALFNNLPACDAVLYTAPPPNQGAGDARLAAVLHFWHNHPAQAPQHLVYISTTGVYGDCGGAWVNETAPLKPQSARAKRRVDAEQQLKQFSRELGVAITILRAPGIYALERLPLQRIRDGVPMLSKSEDPYSNHIHADDLAMMCVAALNQASVQGVQMYNACDDLPLKMGDWFSALAQAVNLPVPPRCDRVELIAHVTALQWSFMRESRRLSNAKIKAELGISLRYPNALMFLSEHFQS